MRRQRARHELRSYAGADLYERLLREAAAQGITVSECIRNELEDLHRIRDEFADALRVGRAKGSAGRGILETILGEMEARLAGELHRHGERMDEIDRRLARLEAMIDRFYAGVMLHLAEVPEQDRPTRLKQAAERQRAWREAVNQMIARPPAQRGSDGGTRHRNRR